MFFPLRKFLVEQFHLLYLNWCWHSATAMLAPLATADKTPGFSLASLLCFRLRVEWIAGSMIRTPGDIGDRLFGSPALAIPLQQNSICYKDILKNCKWRAHENKSDCPKAIRLTFVTVKDNAWRSKNLIKKKPKINTSWTPLKAMGATRNEMLIWKGKDNKQLTTELSIRRRLDKYLRRALILEGRAGKHSLRAIEITACWLGLASPTYSAYSKKRPRCTLAVRRVWTAGNRITFLFAFLCSRVLRKYERVRRKFSFPTRIHGDDVMVLKFLLYS